MRVASLRRRLLGRSYERSAVAAVCVVGASAKRGNMLETASDNVL